MIKEDLETISNWVGIPTVNLYLDNNFNKLMELIRDILLNGHKERILRFSVDGDATECYIPGISYGRTENSDYKEAVISMIAYITTNYPFGDDKLDLEDVELFRSSIYVQDWC